MTRVLIIADMEGVSGLERVEACSPIHSTYSTGVQQLADDVNIVAREALSLGAESVSVMDWHAGGGNLTSDMLVDGASVVAENLSPGYDIALLVGFHAMAGASPGFISHTMSRGLVVEINGRQVGELFLLSRWLGEADIPIALVTGDRAATLEAELDLPETPSLTVKQAISWSEASCLPVERSHQALAERTRRALTQRERWCVYQPSLPAQVRFLLREGSSVAGLLPWVEQSEDGWISCELSRTREIIDLIDLLSAVISASRSNRLISTLRDDSRIAPVLDEYQQRMVESAGDENPWPPRDHESANNDR